MPKQETITPKHPVTDDAELKIGAKEIRHAYFKDWYSACKDVYNKERRRKRKERRKENKGNG